MAETPLDLNNPDTRQSLLVTRLQQGGNLVAKDIAGELAVSLDTIRRDLIALEKQGLLKRVKGGAVPASVPAKPFFDRLNEANAWLADAQVTIQSLLNGVQTLFLDGGTSTLAIAKAIPVGSSITVITPSPVIASHLLERQVDTILLGGRLRPLGAIATGANTVRDIGQYTADMAVLGVCGLDCDFGLSADDLDEADVKRTMVQQARKTVLLASKDKLHLRSPYLVTPIANIDVLVTNADSRLGEFVASDIEVMTV
ncbi:DeoR/GlpR transcriptional regulator [Photobacterium sanctipauli]|uniref:DeoR/GlpR transcriptional regulator n=1 Tax=Photobacterium sanctipauli TaxID=1342794 RepID=A0A2T3NX42_9GAMM|nr:DeoR/GlpR family DNA-binding transcription regulator [Photobacterium sanctipauli]PSW20769.1 DeoR/GlpR transcriptional regulator [Photobacterium sanctipauli]